jgi:hypothetical protein
MLPNLTLHPWQCGIGQHLAVLAVAIGSKLDRDLKTVIDSIGLEI